MQTVKEIKEWLSEFPDSATVSFATSANKEYLIASLYPREDCEDKDAKHVYIDLEGI